MATATEPVLSDIVTLDDLLEDLGGISPRRVRLRPKFGTATEADLIELNGAKRGIFELVNGVLVEKAMGQLESFLAAAIITILQNFVIPRNLGIITAPDGMMRLAPTIFRAPDIAFITWGRIPGNRVSKVSLAEVVPDLAVEVLSPSNTPAEMARKRREYFAAGVRLVWEVDPEARTIAVYEAPEHPTILNAAHTLEGADVLPDFVLPLANLFGALDRQGP